MAERRNVAKVGDGEENLDEAEEKLLQPNELVLPSKEERLAVLKSAKKVKLPEEENYGNVGGGRFTIGPAPEPEWEMVPPDGKWGWCVLVGATIVNILIPGTIKSFGVLLVEFNDVFNATAAQSSVIVSLCYFLYSSLGPLSSILSVKWSYRTVTLIGGSFAAFGMIFSSFAFNIAYLYVSFGVMIGTGAGLAFPPTVYIVTSYFVRLRGLANGICMSGSAFGSIILPPALRFLLETYGYKGAVLILGGIMLNVWAAALLFQPVEQHLVRAPRPKDEEQDECLDRPQDDTLFEEDEYQDRPQTIKEHEATMEPLYDGDKPLHLEPFVEEEICHIEEHENQPKLIFTSEESTPSEKHPNGSPFPNDFIDENSTNQNFIRSVSAVHVTVKTNEPERVRKISTPVKIGLQHNNSKLSNYIPNNQSFTLDSVPEGKTSQNLHDPFANKKLNLPKTPKRSPSASSFQYMSTPFHGSTLSAFEKPSEFASQFSLKSVKGSLAPLSCFGRKKRHEAPKKEPNRYFDITLLKDPIYLVILISNCTCAISYTNFIILVPSYAQECGFDKSLGAYLLSIISLLDLIGRIGGSALSDVVQTPKRYFFITGLLISGISLAAIPLVSTYLSISIFCSVFGLASGINVGVTALVMTEMLGTERLMSSYGISLFMNGILQLVGPPICGFWFTRTQSYKSLFITLGFILIAGACLWGLVPIIKSRKKRELERKSSTVA